MHTENYRTRVIKSAYSFISNIYSGMPLNLIEIGCMFQESEGLSTLILAEFVSNLPNGSRFLSIEYDPNHIELCKNIFNQKAPHLLEFVEFNCGHSLSLLPGLLQELGTVHFISLDGGAKPEVCLQEFELSATYIAENGIILVDDVVDIKPYEGYPLHRTLGKATLILPVLLICEYLLNRDKYRIADTDPDEQSSIPESQFINLLLSAPNFLSYSLIPLKPFEVIGKMHKMLIYGGNLNFINNAKKIDPTYNLNVNKNMNVSSETEKHKILQRQKTTKERFIRFFKR